MKSKARKISQISHIAVAIAIIAIISGNGCNYYVYIEVNIERTKSMPGEEMIIGPILGQLMAGLNDQRQLSQQGRLMAQQVHAQQYLTDYNQKVALDTWEKTNYAAQVKQMEKAGLNPGLMYKQGGPGGTLHAAPGSVTGGQAPHGGGEQMMAATVMAQINLMQAQADKAKAEADNIRNVEAPKGIAQTDLFKAQTGNVQIDTAIKNYQAAIAKINAQIAGLTEGEAIQRIVADTKTATEEAKQAKMTTQQQAETLPAVIHQIKTNSVEQLLRIGMAKANIAYTEQQTKEAAARIVNMQVTQMQNWDKMSQTDREIQIKQTLAGIQQEQMDWRKMMDVYDRIMPNIEMILRMAK